MRQQLSQESAELRVASYTDVIGPDMTMLGPISGGGILVAHTAPGCWGPMITPELRGGHEVTRPVAVSGAEVGDAVALKILRISILSKASASGTDAPVPGRFLGDAGVAAKCPDCGIINPPSYLDGIGSQAVRCKNCGREIIPYRSPNGYTMVFDSSRTIALTVNPRTAEEIASQHAEYSGLAPGARQHSALVMALSDIPGILTRIRPMVGNIGTVPAATLPASKNAGDVIGGLVGAQHALAIHPDQLSLRTDAHMDIDSVGEGTVVICPVKVPGAGIYIGDVHAMQGDGETAGHTTDVSAEVVLQVTLIKGLEIEGPILLPRPQELPPLARPYSVEEISTGRKMAQTLGIELEAPVAPVQVVGTGPDLGAAVNSGLDRLSKLAGVGRDEIRNRVTITGAIEIGRLPGVVQVTCLLPLARLDQLGLGDVYRLQYDLS